jgi:hypothetical protein
MSDLVMRLETAVAKCDVRVRQKIGVGYPQEQADMRELLQEAARRIKELEHDVFRLKTENGEVGFVSDGDPVRTIRPWP